MASEKVIYHLQSLCSLTKKDFRFYFILSLDVICKKENLVWIQFYNKEDAMGLWICWITIMKFKFQFQRHKFQYIFQSIFWPTLEKFNFVRKVQNVKAIYFLNQNSHCIVKFPVQCMMRMWSTYALSICTWFLKNQVGKI